MSVRKWRVKPGGITILNRDGKPMRQGAVAKALNYFEDEIERLTASRAAIAEEQIALRNELDEAQRHWDKQHRRAETALAEVKKRPSAAALADLLITDRYLQRIKTDGIDGPGVLTDALDELEATG